MDETHIRELEAKLADTRGLERIEILNALAGSLRHDDLTRAHAFANEAFQLAQTGATRRMRELRALTTESGNQEERDDPAVRLYHKCRAFSLGHIGYCLGQQGKVKESNEALQQALKDFQMLGIKEGKALILYLQGCSDETRGAYESALANLSAARDLFRKTGGRAEEADALLMMGAVYLHQNHYHAALEAMNQSLELSRQGEDPNRQAHILTSLGVVYMDLNDYEKALEFFLQCQAMSARIHDKNLEATNLNNLGSLHYDLHDFGKAQAYYEQSYALRLSLHDIRGQAISLNGIGICLSRSQKYQEALDKFTDSLALLEQAPAIAVQTIVLNNIGDIHSRRQHYKEARTIFKLSLEISRQVGDRQQIAQSLYRIGKICLDQQAEAEARLHFQEALVVSEGVNIRGLALDIRMGLARACQNSGDMAEAGHHYEAALVLKDKLAGTEADDRLNKLRILHEVAQTQQEREILRLRNKQLEQDMELQRRDLTANALHISQKNDLLRRISRDLSKVLRAPAIEFESRIRDMQREINSSIGSEDAWTSFEEQFKNVHLDFLETLTSRYPKLTATERRVCALVKLNLSNKEISRMMNVAPRSIEVYRNRIRKKLALPPESKLSAFLLSLR